MLNALRTLDPQATHTVIVSFGPNAPKEVRFRLCGVKLEKEHEYQDLKNQERFLFAIHATQATHTVIVSFGPNAPKEVRFRLCGVKLEKEHEYQDLKNQERFLFVIHVNLRHF